MTEPENPNARYLVKTPWHTDSLSHPDELFPEVTPEGVEMSAEEREHAKAAAKAAHIKLSSKEVS